MKLYVRDLPLRVHILRIYFGLKYIYREYFKAKVKKIWVHGPFRVLGFSTAHCFGFAEGMHPFLCTLQMFSEPSLKVAADAWPDALSNESADS